jgi:hypothetical protein
MLNDDLVDKAEGIGSSGWRWDVGSRPELEDELAIGGGKRLREEGLLLLLLFFLFLGGDFLETGFSVDLSLGGGDSLGWLRGSGGCGGGGGFAWLELLSLGVQECWFVLRRGLCNRRRGHRGRSRYNRRWCRAKNKCLHLFLKPFESEFLIQELICEQAGLVSDQFVEGMELCCEGVVEALGVEVLVVDLGHHELRVQGVGSTKLRDAVILVIVDAVAELILMLRLDLGRPKEELARRRCLVFVATRSVVVGRFRA